MNSHQKVSMEQINSTFPPHNNEGLSEEQKLQTPGQGPASTIISVPSYEDPPKDFFAWSVFNTLYMNFCCLGFMALVFSVKARDRKVVGDLHAARSYGSTAKCLNICALTLTLLLLVPLLIVQFIGLRRP
ncbi:interferon-induced transmembrane protein 1-like [Macrotis lagotis]|uniref:interferon-induced transmembrane protein 1-like n=1 Tax=Macrotis lagotis TaxID=92651 RepID=UPI003D69CFBA